MLSHRSLAALLMVMRRPANAQADFNATSSDGVTEIDFMFPIVPGVNDGLIQVMNGMVDQFNSVNPTIVVTPIYSGSYGDTLRRVIERVEAGNPPAVAVTNINTAAELDSLDYIIPLTDYITAAGGKEYLDQYYSAMFGNELIEGEILGWPMMRSTPVLYYNQDMLDEKNITPPTTWEELVDSAEKLTTEEVKGLGLPDTWSDWIFGAFSREAGTQLIEDDWTTVTFDSGGNTKALDIWDGLAKGGSIPVPLTPWSTAIDEFNAGSFAMLYFTTGGITKVESGANFAWSCIYCPAGPDGFGVEEGGGDFHIFNNTSKAKQDAAWSLIQFLTNPENAAIWSVSSGYIAVNKEAMDEEIMKVTVEMTPQRLVAQNQLEYSHPQMTSVNIQLVREAVKASLGDVVQGTKTVSEAQAYGQAEMTAAIEAWNAAQSEVSGGDDSSGGDGSTGGDDSTGGDSSGAAASGLGFTFTLLGVFVAGGYVL